MEILLNVIKSIWKALTRKPIPVDVVVPSTSTTSNASKEAIVPSPITAVVIPTAPLASQYIFDTPQNAEHSVRLICDAEALTWDQKNEVTGTIWGESRFKNFKEDGTPVVHLNYEQRIDGTFILDEHGNKILSSTDYGLCQINDRYHIGVGKDFPSVDYVMQNPRKVVEWMITMYKAGKINLWDAHLNGSYKEYVPPSPTV